MAERGGDQNTTEPDVKPMLENLSHDYNINYSVKAQIRIWPANWSRSDPKSDLRKPKYQF